ncbi:MULTISPECIES: single-stranded DNA-binding protein [Arthrobacter]|uniref:Single-stranded DNA-binding protein n=1 Tax=Arthrobacter sunyaminii TaxID=2816859 RepID=A0A975PCE8_9MICC|nr:MULTISPECIES: single-stranded DNA-binding protein [Arthrobacter]MBO0907596.1 single-stranded DNA-binding protein [Arthrobacter sunyaminii]QWQ35161.1 single-stranded DNA-binding protein [Arthrobacter sunyaminii]
MSDTITLRGYVATDVRSTTADSGLAIAGFRMCTTERRYDRDTGSWADGQTNWFSVSLFRQLATNAAFSVHKGDRVIVTGRLKVRQWVSEDGRSGTSVDIDAESVGHDLMWGTANYRRNVQDRAVGGAGAEGSEGSAGEDGEDGGTDDLPADLDLDTGELVGTASDGIEGDGSENNPQDPNALPESGLSEAALSKTKR